ncbi:DUF3158 family protein [Halomonas marinisediminis]|uniref:DUF3158 family protein n=1 Tax=Halomonas marinisediminis TaxID=2546095 RepID=A0ABY2D5V8_9GAMM|nr:DUF3158 family protein [Halomonas marinisediminis]TDB02094.1 DUF3158 family protein [Halomonas marinisediminis]
MNIASNRYGNDAFISYAKGFLKPFKGKGELVRLRDELEEAARAARQEAIDTASQENGSLLKSTGLWLTPWGKSGVPTRTLQWRDNRQRRMGLWLLEAFLSRDDISEAVRQSVIDLEVERCVFNAKAATINGSLKRISKALTDIQHAVSFQR